MKSWWMVAGPHGPELALQDTPTPTPGPGQLLVKVQAAGLNRGEFITGQTDEEMLLVAGRSEPIPGGTRKMNRHDTNIPKGGLNGLPKDWEAYVFAFGVSIDRVMRGKTATPAVGVFPDGGGAYPLLYFLVRRLRPRVVVETGVGTGWRKFDKKKNV